MNDLLKNIGQDKKGFHYCGGLGKHIRKVASTSLRQVSFRMQIDWMHCGRFWKAGDSKCYTPDLLVHYSTGGKLGWKSYAQAQ